ncbi:hypothetical protein OWV82_020136 [Melia azedarach]|uniref:Uncharacterized protein n=1 Tax=Melia azedarach TaxID=155640 RepID=A0ACC1X5X9_MELAZ|nr:hypothetical protein OWV82_020136 [Melia azedarach]
MGVLLAERFKPRKWLGLWVRLGEIFQWVWKRFWNWVWFRVRVGIGIEIWLCQEVRVIGFGNSPAVATEVTCLIQKLERGTTMADGPIWRPGLHVPLGEHE